MVCIYHATASVFHDKLGLNDITEKNSLNSGTKCAIFLTDIIHLRYPLAACEIIIRDKRPGYFIRDSYGMDSYMTSRLLAGELDTVTKRGSVSEKCHLLIW